jgi:hypothetical protein
LTKSEPQPGAQSGGMPLFLGGKLPATSKKKSREKKNLTIVPLGGFLKKTKKHDFF